jgi:hypothetical protein
MWFLETELLDLTELVPDGLELQHLLTSLLKLCLQNSLVIIDNDSVKRVLISHPSRSSFRKSLTKSHSQYFTRKASHTIIPSIVKQRNHTLEMQASTEPPKLSANKSITHRASQLT